jgi:ligand-binding SRPBCC domain-containing protein
MGKPIKPVDHLLAAKDTMTLVDDMRIADPRQELWTHHAQVHALIALAEAQQTANLIAAARIATRSTDLGFVAWDDLVGDIRKKLGLG